MSDSWTSAVESLIEALRNERIAAADEDEVTFLEHNARHSISMQNLPPGYTEYEGFQPANLSPVDYDNGRGEWRELDILPHYTTEDLQRIMQEVYNEYMDGIMHGSNENEDDDEDGFEPVELIYGNAAVNEYLDSLPDPATFGEDSDPPQAPNGISGSETVETKSEQLPGLLSSRLIPLDTHSEASGAGHVDDVNEINEIDGASDPANGPNGQPSSQTPSRNSPLDEPGHNESDLIPELVVTDYDHDHPMALRHPYQFGSANGRHIPVDLDSSTDELSEVDSLPHLERMLIVRNRPSGTHSDRNGVETSSDALVGEIESPVGLAITDGYDPVPSEPRERDTSRVEDPVSRSAETLVNDTGPVAVTEPIGHLNLAEAAEYVGYSGSPHPEIWALTDQGTVRASRQSRPRWSRNIEVVPAFEIFTDYGNPDEESDVTNDWEELQQGRFGDQGDDDDIPWDARPVSYFESGSGPDNETPRAPLRPVPNAFEDLVTVPDDGETIDYSSMPDVNPSENQAQAAGMMTSWRLPADPVVTQAGW
ncbi:uncharacterized protein KD926_004288 [Aspergillus affinis]|uniref:uncharacterized protein n=1 Tax=Aspergillus affinis TaxID=1070780 RepID=UPI0022FF351D|nr:uncharacterized protein KD926_004288 [Aspergillus affinis]KAI9035204.1 hypothetical protein KD926_004288 [Aspergillus affinis]